MKNLHIVGMLRLFISFIAVVLMASSCTNNLEEINALTEKIDVTKDVGTGIKIIYSDSGNIKLTIEAPLMERYNDYTEPKQIFSKGILVTFMDDNKQPMSWLKADYAERLPVQKKMIAKGNVQFYNIREDKLRTSELNWDETSKIISTEKFVKITQPSQQDTIYGQGLITDYDFKRMEITNKFKAKISSESFN
jgi:LPS export ABC transporter protein LptC